jgi:hypothetical protein
VVAHLAKIAGAKVRLDLRGKLDYDYSSIRLTAALALQHLTTQVEQGLDSLGPKLMSHLSAGLSEEVAALLSQLQSTTADAPALIALAQEIAAIDPHLVKLLQLWRKEDVPALLAERQSGDSNVQAIAALALGDLYVQTETTEESQTDLESIMAELVRAFNDPALDEAARWAVTHALAMADPAIVTKDVILDLIQQRPTPSRLRRNEVQIYKCLVYLIGRTRCQEAAAQTFLIDDCLRHFKSLGLLAGVIEALGWLADRRHQRLLEDIACGQFDAVPLARQLSSTGQQYLRLRAIEALDSIGDLDTLTRLRNSGADWAPKLRRAFYRTSEEIYWRLSRK